MENRPLDRDNMYANLVDPTGKIIESLVDITTRLPIIEGILEALKGGAVEQSIDDFPRVTPESDDTGRLKRAIKSIVDSGVRGVLNLKGKKLVISSRVDIDVSYVSLNGGGAIISAAALTSGTALYITGTKLENNIPALAQATGFLANFSLEGDTTASRGKVGTVGIEMNSATGAGPSNIKFYNMGAHHFETDITFKNHAYIIDFFGCNFSKAKVGIHTPSGFTDYGERMTFVGCTIANCDTLVKGENPDGSLHFTGCSFDYPTGKFFEINGTQAFLHGCHIEGAGDKVGAAPITLSGNGATFIMNGGKFMFNSTTPGYANVFNIQASTSEEKGGGVYLDGVFLFNLNPTTGFLATGSGHISVKNWFSYDTSQNYAFLSAARNNLIDGGFEMASIVDNWFIFQDAAAVTDKFTGTNIALSLATDQFKAGTKSLKVAKTAVGGSPAQFALAVPVSGANRYGASINYKKVGTGTGNIYADMRWAVVENNASGLPTIKYNSASISAKTITFASADVNWTNTIWSPKLRKPAWATHMIITFNISNLSNGTTFYIDDCLVNEM